MPDDDERFTRIYRENHRRVLGYALRRAAPEAALEAVDEAFLIAWRKLPAVPDPPLPWLLVTCRNVLSEQRRGGRRADALVLEISRTLSSHHGADAAEAVVERSMVLQALAGLSDTDREALMLTVWDGLRPRDAAVVAGCSAATFTVRLHRARRRLRASLESLDEAGIPELPRTPLETR